jgi:hypothetical protein
MNFPKLITTLAVFALSCAPLALVAGDAAGKARIVTGNGKPAQCISPVHVTAIDGKQTYVNKLGFDLEPGEHSLKARAIIDTSFCRAPGRSTGKDTTEPLTATFEAGKTYYLGFDHSASNRREWKLVIWDQEG